MAALLQLCPSEIRERAMNQIDDMEENYDRLKEKVIMWGTNQAERNTGPIPMDIGAVHGCEHDHYDGGCFAGDGWDANAVEASSTCHLGIMLGIVQKAEPGKIVLRAENQPVGKEAEKGILEKAGRADLVRAEREVTERADSAAEKVRAERDSEEKDMDTREHAFHAVKSGIKRRNVTGQTRWRKIGRKRNNRRRRFRNAAEFG